MESSALKTARLFVAAMPLATSGKEAVNRALVAMGFGVLTPGKIAPGIANAPWKGARTCRDRPNG